MEKGAIITSRTVLASAILTTIALLGVISPEAIPHSSTARILIGAVVVACFFATVYFRVTAKIVVAPDADDRTLASLIIVPLLLSVMFTQGCLSADTAQETWDKLSPAEKTLVIADSIQSGFIRTKELYGEVYQAVPADIRDKMSTTLAPKINKAQPVIEAFVQAAIVWNSTNEKPEDIDKLKADAQAAYSAISSEMQDLALTSQETK